MDMSDRIEYTGPMNGMIFSENYYSGRIKNEDGKWFCCLWNVSYCQGVCHGQTFTCKAKADEYIQRKLEELRQGWGYNGSKFTETKSKDGGLIVFRSVRKNGKPGTATGRLSITSMLEIAQRINQGKPF